MNAWLDSKPADSVEKAIENLVRSEIPANKSVVNYAGEDKRFALWLYLTDKRCLTQLGVGIFDLEDWHWRDAYDSNSSPKEALAHFVEDLGLSED
jgi:hypothetical protein